MKEKYKELLVIIFVFISSFLIRWNKIESQPYGIEGDEFSLMVTTFLTSHNIPAEEKGIWSMHTSMARDYPIPILINEIGFSLFGRDLISIRKILVLVNSIALIFFYLLCRSFFSRFISLIITILYSFTYYKLISTRIAMGPAYIDIFLYFTFYCLLQTFSLSSKRKYLFAAFSGIGATLSVLTSNISYIIPVICFMYIISQFFNSKITKKELLITIVIFLLPLICFSPKWINSFKEENARKKYALSNWVFNVEKKQFNLSKFQENLLAIKGQLFQGLTYQTSDMLVAYDSPLFPKIITVWAILGLLLSVLKLRKYFFIILWFISTFSMSVIFGLFLPRMWVVGVGSFFVLDGIIMTFFEEQIKNKYLNLFFKIILIFISLIYIKTSLDVFYLDAVNNKSFLSKDREIVDLAKKHKKDIPKKIIFISTPEFNHGIVFPTVNFYFLAEDFRNREIILKTKEDYFQILNKDELIDKELANFAKVEFIIVDNTLLQDDKVKYFLDKFKHKISGNRQYKDFTEISLFTQDEK